MNIENYEKAGKIAAQAREFGKTLCKENALVLDIVEKIEQKIIGLGAKPAFPINVSLNHIAAHQSPIINDTLKLTKGDLVKLDIGVHIEGSIADTACTIEISTNNYKKLIEASEQALKEAIKITKIGTSLNEIGKTIQQTIQNYGYSPIKNLSGHELKEYEVHAGLVIPNYDNGDSKKLEKGMIIAIEPFATPGIGEIKEGKPSGIFALIEKKPIRNLNARKVLDFIEKEYRTLPFSARWLKFPNINFILRILEKEGILKQYDQLPEKSNALVSQAEHTLLIDNEVKILTK